MIKQLLGETNNTTDVLVNFAVLLVYEKCVHTQLFSSTFSSFQQQFKNKSFCIIKNLYNTLKKNPLILTVCYNDFINEMGFHVFTLSRLLLDKALKTIYNVSFTVRSSKGSAEIQERAVYHSSRIIGLQNCISPMIQEIKQNF